MHEQPHMMMDVLAVMQKKSSPRGDCSGGKLKANKHSGTSKAIGEYYRI